MAKPDSTTAISLAVLAVAFVSQGETTLEQEVVRGIDHAQEMREQCLDGFSVTEHYFLKNSHFEEPAEMLVKATYRKGIGKTYEILSRSGPSLLKGRVFDSILRGETEMSHGEIRHRALVISENYTMHLAGIDYLRGRRCYIMELDPKRRSPQVVKGRAWISADDYSLMRIEGRLAASPSFWSGKPVIVREYEPMHGFWLAQKNQVHSEGFFSGKTDFSEEYSDYKILTNAAENDVPHKASRNPVCEAFRVKPVPQVGGFTQ